MKKIMLSLAVLVGLSFVQINAQGISGGIKADANLSGFILSDVPATESDLGFGATLGGFLKADITNHFAIQPELLFHFKTSTNKTGGFDNNYQYWGAEIPIYAMGQWGNYGRRFYVGVGPYVGLGFSAKYDNTDLDLYEKVNDTSVLRRFDFGFGAMLGYEFPMGLQINAGYKIGVLDMMDAGRDNASMLPQTISLGLGYRF